MQKLELLQYAIACDAAYEEEIPIDPILQSRYSGVRRYQVGGAAAYIAYNQFQDDFLIVHRGTDQIGDIWRACVAAKTKFDANYLEDELEVFKQIREDFPTIKRSISWVGLTGHSWGGVMASLHSTILAADTCVTFGCPRLGQPTHWDERRVVNALDPIPWLLPWFDHGVKPIKLPGPFWSCLTDHFASSYVRKLKNENTQVSIAK